MLVFFSVEFKIKLHDVIPKGSFATLSGIPQKARAALTGL
jgi:hypothetical protein